MKKIITMLLALVFLPSIVHAYTDEQTQNREIIIKSALEWGVNPYMALAVSNCESGFNADALGDKGHSRGLWQIYDLAHPDVSKAMAYNPASSTEWAMPRLKNNPYIWTCWRILYGRGY